MSTKNIYHTRYTYTLAAHATLGDSINKSVTNQHSPRALLYTQHLTEKYIYIINFVYITITITSYARHLDHITRGSSQAMIHYGAVDSTRIFAPPTDGGPNPGFQINHYHTSMPDNISGARSHASHQRPNQPPHRSADLPQ